MAASSSFRSLLIVMLLSAGVHAQSTFTLKYFGMTIHPFGDRTAELQPYKLDKEAHVVLNFGGFAGYERFVYKDFVSVKVIQGVFTDCSAGWCSVTHIGARMRLIESKKHRVYLGIGPTLLMRNSWERFGQEYASSGYFETGSTRLLGDIQWKFLLYGAEIEYDYRWTERNHLSVSFTPGLPLACTFSIGWKHWITLGNFEYKKKLYVPK